MAENESLDLGGPYAQRWNPVADGFLNGEPVDRLCRLFERELRGGVRNALEQFAKAGAPFAELMKCRHSPVALKQLIRRLSGHQYALGFASAALASGPTDEDCIRGWIYFVVDRVMDQVANQVVGNEPFQSAYEVQDRINEVRQRLEPVVEQITTSLANDQEWRPRQARGSTQTPEDATAEILGTSLLGGVRS